MPDTPARSAVIVAECGIEAIEEWSALRTELWPDGNLEEHRGFTISALGDPTRLIAYIARDLDGKAVGFAEASLRFDYVNGASTSPVGFLEGLYVRQAARRQGIGRGMVAAVEQWARERGCTELASDALIDNEVSHDTHRGIGFAETERVVFFLKPLEVPVTQ